MPHARHRGLQQGGAHPGFSEHWRAVCWAFVVSNKREFSEFLRLAGTGYIRIDMYPGQQDVFLHWRDPQDAANDVEAIRNGLFKGCDVECVQLGRDWYIQRQAVFEASKTHRPKQGHRSPCNQKSQWRIEHGFVKTPRHTQGSTV